MEQHFAIRKSITLTILKEAGYDLRSYTKEMLNPLTGRRVRFNGSYGLEANADYRTFSIRILRIDKRIADF
ncbi:MAG: hypothetical protein EOO03_12000 [Chitinophagaceae bacterium]|nr:MAG: hypothetical protein EOO03_12000 [Chitinophagaceae bacterium]